MFFFTLSVSSPERDYKLITKLPKKDELFLCLSIIDFCAQEFLTQFILTVRDKTFFCYKSKAIPIAKWKHESPE